MDKTAVTSNNLQNLPPPEVNAGTAVTGGAGVSSGTAVTGGRASVNGVTEEVNSVTTKATYFTDKLTGYWLDWY